MAEQTTHGSALGDRAAFQLANVTKTPPQYGAITPRWLVRLMDWKPLEAGTFRVNRVVNDEALDTSNTSILMDPFSRRLKPTLPIGIVKKTWQLLFEARSGQQYICTTYNCKFT